MEALPNGIPVCCAVAPENSGMGSAIGSLPTMKASLAETTYRAKWSVVVEPPREILPSAVNIDNNEREIRMVQKSLTLPNGVALPVVMTVEARKIFAEED